MASKQFGKSSVLTFLHKTAASPRFKTWLGPVVILSFTLVFFAPLIGRIGSYSEGGDAMFNAWTLARNHHCILQQHCLDYSQGNIFFPHEDTMLYSEAQLSTGLVTLPLHFINQNPIFAYNIAIISSFFLMGLGMYLLALYLSRENVAFSIVAGLIFAYAPFRMYSLSHLQNVSIFCLPFAILFILKFFDTKMRKYLAYLLLVLLYQFYASWYQMVFIIIAIGFLLLGTLLYRRDIRKLLVPVVATIGIAGLLTYPLARQYMRFSKDTGASFQIHDQTSYSSSVADFFIPQSGTVVGEVYKKMLTRPYIGSYNPDSPSYYGFSLVAAGLIVLVIAYRSRKKNRNGVVLVSSLWATGAAGVLVSLGPILKLAEKSTYSIPGENLQYVIPMPYLLADLLLPQLSFMRALGRAGVLFLFALCCLFALFPIYLRLVKFITPGRRKLVYAGLFGLIAIELLPLHVMPMRQTAYSYNLSIPAVYKYVAANNDVDNVVILSSDWDYPDAGIPIKLPEQVLWAGYHNKNIFNGYSGYLPPDYYPQFYDFIDFHQDDVAKMKKLGLRYVLVDKQLSTQNKNLPKDVVTILGEQNIRFDDTRYTLVRIP